MSLSAGEIMNAAFLNGTASILGSSASFVDGNTYGFDDLNGITKAITGAGVVNSGNRCECIMVSGQVKVQSGTVIFESGARLEVGASGVFLDYESGVKNYVYALNNTLTNTIYCITTTTAPEGDYVNLAEIAADGTLTDTRTYSSAKVNLATLPAPIVGTIPTTTYAAKSTTDKTISVGGRDIKVVIVYKKTATMGGRYCGFYDFENDDYWSIDVSGHTSGSNLICYYNSDGVRLTATVTKNGSNDVVLSIYNTDNSGISTELSYILI